MTNPIEPKDVGMYWLETNRELDALFRKNLAPVEVDIDRLWVGIEYRLTPKKGKIPSLEEALESMDGSFAPTPSGFLGMATAHGGHSHLCSFPFLRMDTPRSNPF